VRKGLVDEMEIHVVPVLLGGGARLLKNLDGGPSGYECVELVSSRAAAPYSYVRKDGAKTSK
jgi:riboflavin biosynthesis pyrimidine reductase